jgi:hypothetical protein
VLPGVVDDAGGGFDVCGFVTGGLLGAGGIAAGGRGFGVGTMPGAVAGPGIGEAGDNGEAGGAVTPGAAPAEAGVVLEDGSRLRTTRTTRSLPA